MADGVERALEDLVVCSIEAKVEFSDRFVIACRIKELSPSAFRIQISDLILVPDEFDLLIPVLQGVDQRCPARLVWRTDDMVCGAFVTPFGQ